MLRQLFVWCLVIFTTGADFQESYDLGTTDDILMQLDDNGVKQSDIAAVGQYGTERS